MAKLSPNQTAERPRLEWVPPGSAKPNPSQWVEHPEAQLAGLRALIFGDQSPGWAGAVVINERTREKGWAKDECGHYYVDGHARDTLAQETGEDIPAVIGCWTPAEEKQLLALINPLGAMAIAVPDKQLALLEETSRLVDDPTILNALNKLKETARAELAIQQMREGAINEVDAEPQMDRGEELQKEWSVEPGQLWQLGPHRLICGDCTDPAVVKRLMNGRKATLFATDPPYLVDYDGTNHPHKWNEPDKNKDWGDSYKDWDKAVNGDGLYDGFIRTALEYAIIENAAWYCWHASRNQAKLEEVWEQNGAFVHQQIVWVKDRPILTRSWYMWQHEPCFFGWVKGKKPQRTADNYPASVWTIPTIAPGQSTDHPTSKPVSVFEIPMQQHTAPGDICYEPFSGSGSQIIAAERLGRICYAAEIAPQYVAVNLQRYYDATGIKPTLIDG